MVFFQKLRFLHILLHAEFIEKRYSVKFEKENDEFLTIKRSI